jgi:hypothetical protein
MPGSAALLQRFRRATLRHEVEEPCRRSVEENPNLMDGCRGQNANIGLQAVHWDLSSNSFGFVRQSDCGSGHWVSGVPTCCRESIRPKGVPSPACVETE